MKETVEAQVLDRALEDTGFRQRLLDDAPSAIAEATGQQPRRVVIDASQRDTLERLLHAAAENSQISKQLIEDPGAAMRAAGLEDEYQEVQRAIQLEKESDLPCLVWSACKCWWGSTVGTEF